MYPVLKTLCNASLPISLIWLGFHSTDLSTPPEPIQQSDDCMACMFQRKGNIPYIIRRAIHESGPDENLTFGHCFVCVRCPQPGNDEPIPWCRGWWPADPNGGDYEGDDGRIYSDEEEAWDTVDCIPIRKEEALQIKKYVYSYSKDHDYQVINQGARSCLGYCSDVLSQIGWEHKFPLGDFTIPGDMILPSSRWTYENTKVQPQTVMDELFEEKYSSTE